MTLKELMTAKQKTILQRKVYDIEDQAEDEALKETLTPEERRSEIIAIKNTLKTATGDFKAQLEKRLKDIEE